MAIKRALRRLGRFLITPEERTGTTLGVETEKRRLRPFESAGVEVTKEGGIDPNQQVVTGRRLAPISETVRGAPPLVNLAADILTGIGGGAEAVRRGQEQREGILQNRLQRRLGAHQAALQAIEKNAGTVIQTPVGLASYDHLNNKITPLMLWQDMERGDLQKSTDAMFGPGGPLADATPDERKSVAAAAKSASGFADPEQGKKFVADAVQKVFNSRAVAAAAALRKPEEKFSEFDTFMESYLAVHNDTPANRIAAVGEFKKLGQRTLGRIAGGREAERKQIQTLASRYLADGQGDPKSALKLLQHDVISFRDKLKRGVFSPEEKQQAQAVINSYVAIRNALLGTAPTSSEFFGLQFGDQF